MAAEDDGVGGRDQGRARLRERYCSGRFFWQMLTGSGVDRKLRWGEIIEAIDGDKKNENKKDGLYRCVP